MKWKCGFFKTRYRVVVNSLYKEYYQAEFRKWWMPFYVQCFIGNTAFSVDDAIEIIKKHQNKLPYYEECF